MWEKLIQLVTGRDCELRERMLRTILLVGGLATILGIADICLTMELDNVSIPLLVVLLLAMAISLFVMFKYRKYDVSAIVIGLLIVAVVFPSLFFVRGGVQSGISVWMALGIFYICVMFTGKRLLFFMALCIAMYGITYIRGYLFPERLNPLDSNAIVYFDSFFSMIVVGACAGLIVKVQMHVFEEEHKQNIEQKEELERNSASKNIFFANMSHEIRTPINAIIGLNEMILRENPTGETAEYAKDIQLASQMLLNQVNDILDLSQMEMKKMKLVPIRYQTKQFFGELAELIRAQIEKKGLDFRLDIDKNLPAVLYGDEKRLKQIILNLLDNAVKYTKEGSVTLSAEAENYGEEEILLKIKVTDTGIGIRKEDMEYLYDSFNRVDENKNVRIAGSGLGLAITKQLVDLMEGEISVDSIYTKGTVFTVTVRQTVESAKPVGEVNALTYGLKERETYQPEFEASAARILIVDDNTMNVKVVSKLLSATKVQTDVAYSGAECLEMTKKKYYHVILLDDMMPGMNGTQTLKEIRNQENGLCRESAIIALTANAFEDARERYLQQGFFGYVEKPVKSRLLETEILKFLPAEVVEYQREEAIGIENMSQMQKVGMKKRKQVYVTSDCACDLPAELLEKYDVRLMYLYIRTPYGRFADTREIDSDSLSQYMNPEDDTVWADNVTVEEYEEFFADVLTQADRVVHIALGARSGRSHKIAVAAAKGFDHVTVIDSEQVSGGQGLVVLRAAKLAMEGRTAEEICREVEKMKGNVRTNFILPSADIFYKTGRTSALMAKLCRILQLHPIGEMKDSKAVLAGVVSGTRKEAWHKAIRRCLRNKKKINWDVVFITHVGCSVEQQQWIKREVLKLVPFERVIIQKASFTNACNTGLESIGISYYRL